MGRKRNDSKKKEVHFENAAIQLVVNSTEKPFIECEGRKEGVEECEEVDDGNVVGDEVQEDKVENEVQQEDKVKETEVQHPTESQHPTIHPTTDQHPTTHLSLLDKFTLGFFVLLNSLGHALKKLARSFLGLFSKDEEEQV